MSLTTWSPFRDMEDFFNRYSRLSGARGNVPATAGVEFDWRPSADISETDDQYIIKADLPEVDKEDVQVSVDNGILTIAGERRHKKEVETETTHRIESVYGKFARSFTLPSDADEASIKAESKNGVLRVRIPKVEQPKAKAIEVTVD